MGATTSKHNENLASEGTPGATAPTDGGEIATPLWKTTSTSDRNSLPCPLQCQLFGPRHHQAYAKRTLASSSLGSHSEILKIKTGIRGGVLLLELQGQIVGVVKGKKIYNAMPCFEEQEPSKFRYNGMRLFEYAQLRESSKDQSIVSIVHPASAESSSSRLVFVDQFTIINGPKNEYSRQVVQWKKIDDLCGEGESVNSLVAVDWKYANNRTHITIGIPDIDVALMLLLIPMSELLDTDRQMRALGKRAIIG